MSVSFQQIVQVFTKQIVDLEKKVAGEIRLHGTSIVLLMQRIRNLEQRLDEKFPKEGFVPEPVAAPIADEPKSE